MNNKLEPAFIRPFLTAALAVGLVACGGSSDNDDTASDGCPTYALGDALTYERTKQPVGMPASTETFTMTVTQAANDQVVFEGGNYKTTLSTADGAIKPVSDEDSSANTIHEYTSDVALCPPPSVGDVYEFTTTYSDTGESSTTTREVTDVTETSVTVAAGTYSVTRVTLDATETAGDANTVSYSVVRDYSHSVGEVKSVFSSSFLDATQELTSVSMSGEG